MKRPCATSFGGHLEPPHAPGQRLRHEERADHRQRERHAGGDQHAVAHEVDRLGHVVEVARVEDDRDRALALAAPAKNGCATWASSSPASGPISVVRVLASSIASRASPLLKGASFSVRESDCA